MNTNLKPATDRPIRRVDWEAIAECVDALNQIPRTPLRLKQGKDSYDLAARMSRYLNKNLP